MRFGVVLVSVAVLALSGCSKQRVTQTEEGVFVLGSVEESESTDRGITPAGRTVVLEGFSGDIRLRGTNGESASFTFTRTARANDRESAAKLLEKIAISETGDESVFTVSMSSPEPARTGVDIVADIPEDTPVSIVTRSGNIEVAGVQGPVSIRNEAGSIEYRGSSSSVDLKSRNGDVSVGIASATSGTRLNLETSNGDIYVSIPMNGNLDVDATTSAGQVRNTGLTFGTTSLALGGAGGHFTGRVGAPTDARLIAKTYHGDITFSAFVDDVVPMPQEEIDIEADSTMIETPMPQQVDSLIIPADDSLADIPIPQQNP